MARKKFVKTVKEKQRANFEDSEDPGIVPKKFWSHVKFSSNSIRIPEIVSYAKRIRNNASDQAELFNEFFYDQFSCSSTYDRHFEPLVQESEKEFYISRFGVLKLLQNINSNKAAWPDGIHGKVLKNCATSLALPLSILYNNCYNIGSIPAEWRSANIVPVHKKAIKV